MATATAHQIVVDEHFKALITPLRADERDQLEDNLVADGCREPLAVWAGHDTLLDGHNRHEICVRRGIAFDVRFIELADRLDAEIWILRNQAGRRNLTDDQRAMYAVALMDKMVEREKRERAKRARAAVVSRNPVARTGNPDLEADATSKSGKTKDNNKKKDRSRATVAKSSGISERKVRQAKALTEAKPEVAAKVMAGEMSLAAATREMKREEVKANLENIAVKEAKAAQGVYDVLVIDPPWAMEKIERDERPNQSEFDYPTMSEEELAALDIHAADDAHAWVWTTHKFLPMALRLLDAWGLKYVCTFVWHKPGGFQPIGLPQYNCEFALYARKGSPKFIDTKAFNVCFDAPRGKHSEKPEEFYDVVRRVTAGRRLDMFNRRTIEGFDGWGNEA